MPIAQALATGLRGLLLGSFGVTLVPLWHGQAPKPGVSYTEAQAAACELAYARYCAECHLPDLRGASQVPPLAGVNFTNTWAARSVQGFPVTYEVDGEQFVAVSAGLGFGSSPRIVPRLLSPEIRHPRTGNALYVFKLPGR